MRSLLDMIVQWSLSMRKEPGGWQSAVLTVLLHAVLLGFLWGGIRWHSHPPEIVEAEIWSAQVSEAAPTVQLEQSEIRQTPPAKPDIALEQDVAQPRHDAGEARKVLADTNQHRPNAEFTQEHKADPVSRGGAESDASNGNGAAAASQGSADYSNWLGQVKAKIVSNATYTVSSFEREANAPVEFTVKLRADGRVVEIYDANPSATPEFNDAVRSAIELSQPYPADASGHIPASLTIRIYPIDLSHPPPRPLAPPSE